MQIDQIAIFRPETERSVVELALAIPPVDCGEYFDLFSLHYSLNPVKDWIKVWRLTTYCGCRHQLIAAPAWIDPHTIDDICIQHYGCLNQESPSITLSWGFGPSHQVNKFYSIKAFFYLSDPEDYELIHRLVKAKRIREMG